MAEWRARNAEHKKAYAKAYYEQNRDARIEYSKQYAEANREKVVVKKKAARLTPEHRQMERQRYAERMANNPEAIKAKTKGYRARNRDRILTRNQNRRAGLKGVLSTNIVEILMRLQRNQCAACRTDLRKSGFHRDHMQALSAGGLNVDSNLQLLCPPCNLSKGTGESVEFMQRKGYLL